MALKRRPPAHNTRRAKTNTKNVWGVMTNQKNETLQFESDKEKTLALTLLCNKAVSEVISQPMRIPFTDGDGQSHTYTPDYLVRYLDGHTEIHEFSMTHARMRPEIRRREEAGRKYCEDQGWDYVIHTEQTLPSATKTANLKTLRRYGPSSYFDPAIANCILSLLADGARVPIDQLAWQVAEILNVPLPWVNSTIFHMLWHGQLSTDMEILLFIEGTPNPRARIWKELPV